MRDGPRRDALHTCRGNRSNRVEPDAAGCLKLQQLREAVAMRNAAGSRVQLEASGGVRLDSVRAIAETGVQRIAVGAITHGATWLDIGLDIGSDIGAGG